MEHPPSRCEIERTVVSAAHLNREADEAQARLEAIGAVLDTYGGNCPVQIDGTFQGESFYFRARGHQWRVYIGDGAPVVADRALYETQTYRPEGISDEDARFAAGWMPLAEAFELLRVTLERWHREVKGGGVG